MVFKKNNPGCGAGGDCDCVSRPCCSDVWDNVRSDYSTVTATLNGTTGDWAPSNPMVATGSFVESIGSPPLVFYQCVTGAINQEPYETHSPPPAPYREWAYEGTVDPDTGIAQKYYADGICSIEVLACNPSPQLKVFARLRYSWIPASNPTTALTGAGYSLDATYIPPLGYSWDRYVQTSGFFTDEIILDTGSGTYQMWLTVTYQRILTNLADMITVIPNPLTLAPAYNPHPMSLQIDFA